MKRTYRIAQNVIEISSKDENDVWASLEWNYDSFSVGSTAQPCVAVELRNRLAEIPAGCPLVYHDAHESPGALRLFAYRDAEEMLYFRIIQPGDERERVLLRLTPDLRQATVCIEEKGGSPRAWQTAASVTSAIQLAFHLATAKKRTLLSHASCVVKEGRAYLFLGKSGTGKSTHSRMWMQAFPDVELLNDDHPVIGVDEAFGAIAYGSPWSGKTPCYKNLSAPIAAIVRIKRAAGNSIRRLSPLEAYASLTPSLFSTPFDRQLSDFRHRAIETLVASVPCYELSCLPNVEAAKVCLDGIG